MSSEHTPSDDTSSSSVEAVTNDAKRLQNVFRVTLQAKKQNSEFHSRRSHKKSRAGCSTCKKRRVKVRAVLETSCWPKALKSFISVWWRKAGMFEMSEKRPHMLLHFLGKLSNRCAFFEQQRLRRLRRLQRLQRDPDFDFVHPLAWQYHKRHPGDLEFGYQLEAHCLSESEFYSSNEHSGFSQLCEMFNGDNR